MTYALFLTEKVKHASRNAYKAFLDKKHQELRDYVSRKYQEHLTIVKKRYLFFGENISPVFTEQEFQEFFRISVLLEKQRTTQQQDLYDRFMDTGWFRWQDRFDWALWNYKEAHKKISERTRIFKIWQMAKNSESHSIKLSPDDFMLIRDFYVDNEK